MIKKTLAIAGASAWAPFPQNAKAQQLVHPQRIEFELVAEFPHDERAFTQGLVHHEGKLYEGTGQYGQSELREVDLTTGLATKIRKLPKEYFGEGIAVYNGEMIQLTWQEGVAFVFRPSDFEYLRRFRYSGEGWGITALDDEFVISDGTSTLRFYDARTFRLLRKLKVRQSGREVSQINELEAIDGRVYANVWHSDYILVIDPKDGQVTGLLDLTSINPVRGPFQFDREKCLNGIAHNVTTNTLYVTGKNWPKLFEIRLKPAGSP